MKIISIELKNYKIHKDFKFDFSGRSAMLIGDSEVGKSTLMNFVLEYLGLKDFDTKALTTGEESGNGILKVEVGDNEYTISRPIVGPDKKSRFKITSSNGNFDSLEAFYKSVMGGIFTKKYFDYNQYFFESKSPAARVKYFADVIGDPRIQENKDKVKEIKSERKTVGAQRDYQEVIKKQSGIDEYTPEELQSNRLYYKEARDISEAKEVKEVFLNTKIIDVEKLSVEQGNISSDVKNLNALNLQLADNSTRISELELELANLKENNILTEDAISKIDPTCIVKLADIDKKLSTAETKNKGFREKADELYEDEVKTITEFNEKRLSFIRGVMSYMEFTKLDKNYQDKTEEIKTLENESKEIFRDSIPIKEISYDLKEDGSEYIMYKGREFTFDNISGGESIRVATKIQKALNPDKSSFILIQNAGLLGSGIDEILKEAKKSKTQIIMEVTERDEPLSIEFVEDNPATILSKRKKTVKKTK
jgi:hypothetical protein